MRRVVVLLLLAVLVNFPWGHELWVAHRLDAHGRDVVVRVSSYEVVEGRYFVRYRVPGSRAVFSARVVEALEARGFDVTNVEGGTAEWIAEGRAIETAAP